MSDEALDHEPNEVPTPISFKLMVILAVAYLGWRFVQGVIWVTQALSN